MKNNKNISFVNVNQWILLKEIYGDKLNKHILRSLNDSKNKLIKIKKTIKKIDFYVFEEFVRFFNLFKITRIYL